MTLPGGPADKLGNRYETWWTVLQLLHLLRGEAEHIRLEVPGVHEAEFLVTAGAQRAFHQVKRNHSGGKWSLGALRSRGVLEAMGSRLAGNGDRFIFASGSDAPELRDLCAAARDAASASEFESAFLAATTRREAFRKLWNAWQCDTSTAFDRLQRIDVRTLDERALEDEVGWGVQALFLAPPHQVVAALRAIVADSVHATITAHQLVENLRQRGYRQRRVPDSASAVAAVQNATDDYLHGARSRLIHGQFVPRAAADELLARLDGATTISALTGRAGVGKTACIVHVVDELRERGQPVLAFRLDRHLCATSTTDLGDRLDLEESPTLVLAEAADAAERPGVLIVDQLDAVSTMSGRSSGVFDIVERLVAEARDCRAGATVQVVVACRAFDWENDHRLRRLATRAQAPVEITDFSDDEIRTILDDAGFNPALFQPRQLALLGLPQNLSLFLDAGFDTSRHPAFDTAKQLFDRYWDAKRDSVGLRVGVATGHWMSVVETLCNHMASAQTLSVSREQLDTIEPAYLDQLVSEDVLTFDGRRYGFGHESFFDYCFARVFVRCSGSLASFLKRAEQHLFQRTLVRQVLAYLRDADVVDRYVTEIRALLSDAQIRPHIKDLVFALLAAVPDPRPDEWAIWEESTGPAVAAIDKNAPNDCRLSDMAWRRLFQSPSWFGFVDQRGTVERWLASTNDRRVDAAVNYLRSHQRHAPDRAAALFEPYADCGDAWPSRLGFVMQWTDLHTSRRFFQLFLRLVDNGVLDDFRGPIAVNSTFWSKVDRLSKERPAWVPEVLAHRVRRRLAVIRAAGGDLSCTELLAVDGSAGHIIATAAEQAPAEFVEHVLPMVLGVSDATVTGEAPPKRDTVWFLLMEAEPWGEAACLPALAGALEVRARDDMVSLREAIAEVRRRDTHVANHLLLAVYRGGAARGAADEAAAAFCAQPWRFECGFSDSPYWCAMQTLLAIVPHCTHANREQLETAILDYVSPWERTEQGYKEHGRARFDLLSAIPPDLRSRRAQKRFDELERKFGAPAGEPRGVIGGRVESPIGVDAAERMTDDQWLQAVAMYAADADAPPRSPRGADEGIRGGARELAEILETRTKAEPERFARLSLRFPASTHPAYLERTLTGLKDTAIASALSGVADRNVSLATWRPQADQEKVEHLYARQALPMAWDFGEASPLSDSTGSFGDRLGILARTTTAMSAADLGWSGTGIQSANATDHPLPDESAGIWFTDPPYYDAIPYSDLSDFFLVWLKRALPGHPLLRDPLDPDNPLSPKKREAVQDETKTCDGRIKDRAFFEDAMGAAFAEGRRVLREDGMGSVVFAHKTTEGWEALLAGLIRGGWTITGSWPIATEMGSRLRARDSAALATSIHLVCRPRPGDAPVGDWAVVLRDLPPRVGEWMERLQAEGVRGADLVFACIGPALEIFSRYRGVETAAGREVGLPEYLEKVWEVVGRTALENVLGAAEARARNGLAGALEEDARLTALFLWALQATTGDAGGTDGAGAGATRGGDGAADDQATDGDEAAGASGGTDATEDADTDDAGAAAVAAGGFTLVFDVVRRFAQPLGIDLPTWEKRTIETRKGVVRLLPVAERARQLFGERGAQDVAAWLERPAAGPDPLQGVLFADPPDDPAAVRERRPRTGGASRLGERRARTGAADETSGDRAAAMPGATTLDRVHTGMLLQAGGQTYALRALLKSERERGPDFLRLSNALSALYPRGSEEKRLLDAMLLAAPR